MIKIHFVAFLFFTLLFTVTGNAHQPEPLFIKILGINDFHGQMTSGRLRANEPVGGAAVLAAYLKEAQRGYEGATLIAVMGDQVGASPPASGLLHDEPAILFTNSLGNPFCQTEDRMNELCNLVATPGNHEFDKGVPAMMELIYGAYKPPTDSWIPLAYYPGAAYPYVSANIAVLGNDTLLFPPYTIKRINNTSVAFIGAILKNAADSMVPANHDGIVFLDEAEQINRFIPEIKARGADVIVVLLHEGGEQTVYDGDTRHNGVITGRINEIVTELDSEVDVVMAGHTHQFLNGYLKNKDGKEILVTQAHSYGESFAEVTLIVNQSTHLLESKSARIVTAFANHGPGTAPDKSTEDLVQLAVNKVESMTQRYVGTAANTLSRQENEAGESSLGNLLSDALRDEMQTDIGLVNLYGIRDDLHQGRVLWGDVYSVLPFSNTILAVSLTGQDIYDLLEQQWLGEHRNMLQISGLSYVYNPQKPLGHKVLAVYHQNIPLSKDKRYSIATTDFLANGSGIFSVMKKSHLIKSGDYDRDVVSHYLNTLEQPFTAAIEGRITTCIGNTCVSRGLNETATTP